MSKDTKLRIDDIISYCYANELGIMDRKVRKQLGAAHMRFLKPLVGSRKRDKRRNVDVRNKLNQDCLVPTKLASARKQNG
jgi:hypothetical protein